ncbi:rhomboid family protein [Falsibacillus albus]|nr:rhomboid family intramembrane serine protease [Falsibacillus albus]
MSESLLFWKLANDLVIKRQYRIVQVAETENEMWLENFSNKKAPVIRLLNHDIDWGNRLQRDIEFTTRNGEKIRKAFYKRQLTVLNVYISSYPPVDDYHYLLEKPHQLSNQKVLLHNVMLTKEQRHEGLSMLNDFFHEPIIIQEGQDGSIEELKQSTLQASVEKSKNEKKLFEFGKPFFTYIFIAIQVIVFILLELKGSSTNPENLIQFGAKYNPLILQGQWWRFITPIFLHIGVLHILMNTLALYYLGIAVEKIYGRMRFLWIYLFAGFAGSVASFVFTDNLSAGASGAIFGCFGALLYFGSVYPNLFFRTMGVNVLVVIGINLVFGFTASGIDNAGHLGGLAGGFLATGVVHLPKKKNWRRQLLFLVLTILLSAGFLIYGFRYSEASADPDVTNSLAQQYIKDKQYGKAEKLLNSYIDQHEGNAVTYFFLSYVELQHGQNENAKQHLMKAIRLNPRFHEAHYNLALIYYDEGNFQKAETEVQEALKYKDDKKYQTLLKEIQSRI